MLRGFPKQIYYAITDFQFYRRVFQQPFRVSLFFALYLCAVLALCLTVYYAIVFFPEMGRFSDWGAEHLPAFQVADGTLTVDADQPLQTEFQGDSPLNFVFDTTGAYADPEGLDEPVLLFAKDKVYFKVDGRTESQFWSAFGDFSFVPKELPSYISAAKWAYFPVAYSFLLVVNLIAKICTAALLSPLAYSIALTYDVRLPYSNCFTIALYSLVPAITIDLAVKLTGVEITYFDLIYLGIAGIYTFFATQKCVLAQ